MYQPWIMHDQEAPIHDPWTADVEKMRRFDYSMTYRFASSFPLPYFQPDIMDDVLRPSVSLERKNELRRKGHAPVLWIASNCHAKSHREWYVQELMRHIEVDSYGDCLRTRDRHLND